MKNILSQVLLCFIFLAASTNASAQGWVTIENEAVKVRFDLPSDPAIADSLHLTLYNGSVDSLLTLQVHVFDSAYLNTEEELLSVALQENEGDTLRAIAQLILFATNSELLNIEDINVNERNGLEMGINYLTLISDVPTFTFMRYFLFNNKFIVFSIAGSQDDVPRLLSYKDTFFNSINFYR